MTPSNRPLGREPLAWLDRRFPRWFGGIVTILVAALFVRAGRGAEPLVVVGWAVTMAGCSALLLLSERARLLDLVLVVAPAVASVVEGSAVFGVEAPLAPFNAQEPGGRATMALRALVFLLVFLRIPPTFPRARVGVASVGALFVASLAARGLVLPMVCVAAFVLRRLAAPPDAPSSDAGLGWGAPIAIGLVAPLVALGASFRSPPPPRLLSPNAQVDEWRARHNLFRARAVALEWARSENAPGEGHLSLAAVDWDLGERGPARRVLEKVVAHPASDEMRRRAEALRQTWGEEAP